MFDRIVHWPILGERCKCWECRAKRGLPGRPEETPSEADLRRYAMVRASGDAVCDRCGTKFYDHPVDEAEQFLHVLCDGTRVKL